jgi:Uma2 family endonuclease
MGMPVLHRRRWTAADVRALMDENRPWPRYELLDGELLVTPAPVASHQLAVGDMYFLLRDYVDAERIGLVVTSPADIELAPETIMQPDVFVIPNDVIPANDPLRWQHVTSLLLAVEVLSPSTMREDRIRKRDFYLANRVDEYWVVDLDARVIERWTAAADRPDIRRDTLTWRPRASSDALLIDVQGYFARNRGLRQ